MARIPLFFLCTGLFILTFLCLQSLNYIWHLYLYHQSNIHVPLILGDVWVTAVSVSSIYLFYKFQDSKTSKSNILCLLPIVLIALMVLTWYIHAPFPLGNNDDSFSIWNRTSRFLFHEKYWTRSFDVISSWMHPDYPLHLPSINARLAHYVGTFADWVPQTVSFMYGVLIAIFLLGGCSFFGNAILGFISCIFIFSMPAFLKWLPAQIADVPLSCHILATVIIWRIFLDMPSGTKGKSHLILLLGFFASSTMWIKNEGLFFYMIFTGTFLWKQLNSKNLRILFLYVSGSLPYLLTLLFFKSVYSPSNDIMPLISLEHVYSSLKNFERYAAISKFILNGVSLQGMCYVLCAGLVIMTHRYSQFKATFGIVLFTLAMYMGVYIITPLDLHWHLETSLDRLALHILPSTLFLVFSTHQQRIKVRFLLGTINILILGFSFFYLTRYIKDRHLVYDEYTRELSKFRYENYNYLKAISLETSQGQIIDLIYADECHFTMEEKIRMLFLAQCAMAPNLIATFQDAPQLAIYYHRNTCLHDHNVPENFQEIKNYQNGFLLGQKKTG